MIEDGFINVDLAVDQPVRTLHQVSHDPDLQHLITLAQRTDTHRGATPDGVLRAGAEVRGRTFRIRRRRADQGRPLARWEDVLGRLESDPMSLSGELDWIAKREILEGYRRRDGLGWDAARLHLGPTSRLGTYGPRRACTTAWWPADAAPGGGARGGAGPEQASGGHPGLLPPRPLPGAGTLRTTWPPASWDSVELRFPGRDSLQRVPTLEPLRGTRNHVKELLDRCRTAEDLVRVLSGQ
ncbi:proteasome accessory factor PafA2 [Streptomyces avidinii]